MSGHGAGDRPGRAWGYALGLVLVGAVALAGLLVALRYVPDLPARFAALRDSGAGITSRRELVAQVGRVALSTVLVLAAIGVVGLRAGASARLRLALSYAAFLTAAGGVALLGVYVVLRYVPDYPLDLPGGTGPAAATRADILDAIVGVSGSILVTLAVIGVSGGWLLAGWILRPLRDIEDAARAAATGDLGRRVRLTGRRDEFRELADTFDDMLDRLDGAFAAQERFAANASHELRTPLTVTATMLDVARRDPDGQDYPQLVERLALTNARAIGLTEALLRLADANAITATSAPLDLATIARDAVAEHAGEAERVGVAVDVRLASAPTLGDAHLLAQLASNLVQNAIRHNLAAGGTAAVTTWHDPVRRSVSLRVENTGRTYTDDMAAQLTEPFLRAGGRVSRADGAARGYGLGLALVARITEVHRGDLDISPRTGGGLVVTFSLPHQGLARESHRA